MLLGPARSKSKSDGSVFYGWWIVAAGCISQAYTSGAFWQGFGAFFDPIVAQFGWSRAITSVSQSLQRTESGMIAPFVGFFIDRFGPRNVMLGGVFVTGIGFIFLSRIDSLWQFYLAFMLITVGLSFGSFMVVTTAVANWFVVRRSRALAIMSAGSGIGGLLVPAVVWIIAATDWRTGLFVIGIGYWVTGIPVAMVMRSRPEDYGYLPDGAATSQEGSEETPSESAPAKEAEVAFTAREALMTRAFWQMILAMGSGQLIMSASIHQIPALSSFGISRGAAGMVIMGVSLISMSGRITCGFLGDVIDKRIVLAFSFACQFLGTLMFAYTGNLWHLLGFMLFWGIGMGASIPVRFALLADYFGRRHFGSILGVMMTTSAVFGIVSPVFVGWMYDLNGNYRDPFLILSGTVLISIPLILTLKPPVKRDPRGSKAVPQVAETHAAGIEYPHKEPRR